MAGAILAAPEEPAAHGGRGNQCFALRRFLRSVSE